MKISWIAILKQYLGQSDLPAVIQKKQTWLMVMAGVVIVLLTYLFLAKDRTSGYAPSSKRPPTHMKLASALDGVDSTSLWLREAQKQLNTQMKSSQVLDTQVKSLQEERHQLRSQLREYDQQLRELQVQLEQLQKEPSFLAPNNDGVSMVASTLPHQPGEHPILSNADTQILPRDVTPPIEQETHKAIATISLNLTEKAPLQKQVMLRNKKNYVPTGSYIKAIMLSGLDADTSVGGQSNPKPVLLRMLDHGSLPNFAKSDLKSCRMVGAGVGDISSERAYIRLDTLSCTKVDGRILDIPVKGHVVGPDGKVGVRGQVVWREQALVGYSFLAGVISGFGKGVAQGYTKSHETTLGYANQVDPTKFLQHGVATGVGDGADTLSKYFIKRADQYSPIVQVSAGTLVDVLVMKSGFYLRNEDEDFDDSHRPFVTTQAYPPAVLDNDHRYPSPMVLPEPSNYQEPSSW